MECLGPAVGQSKPVKKKELSLLESRLSTQNSQLSLYFGYYTIKCNSMVPRGTGFSA